MNEAGTFSSDYTCPDIKHDEKPLDDEIKIPEPPFTIVTGASSNHFCAVHAWIYRTYTAISLAFPINAARPRVIIYNLGLSPWHISILTSLQSSGLITELRTFNFTKYPAFWDLTVARGQYAWKPGIVEEIARDFPGKILWLDAGTYVRTSMLQNFEKLLEKNNGFMSPRSGGSFFHWTHPGLFEYFDVPVPKEFENISNCNGAAFAFDTRTADKLLTDFVDCAYHKDCIAPPGSSRKNHRQDQAALTYIAAREGYYCSGSVYKFGVITHMDGDCAQTIVEFEALNFAPWQVTDEERAMIRSFKKHMKKKDKWWQNLWEETRNFNISYVVG
ncbi:4014_t:CDS:2 [Paraglomus occultum]|uniref:4014_t:CDS:1 n=1 Tax=Paraglomus occultum TaxID=144539 RepID=A0A9N9CDX3_9GLOM|nr:4014_t:CDS:2 [Paraglomus occultum]